MTGDTVARDDCDPTGWALPIETRSAHRKTSTKTGASKVVFANFLQQIFYSLARQDVGLEAAPGKAGLCQNGLAEAVEHVIDAVDRRLRIAPKYHRRLNEPVARVLRYIDDAGEAIPGPVLCSRSSFSDDPYVNAFFASPQHAQEVFSQSEEVRRLFDETPLAEDCWALLCMGVQKKTQPGLALVGDDVRSDVMQTSISLSDHQIVSPGVDEPSARCALKCCMFNAFLVHIRRELVSARTRDMAAHGRLQSLRARQRRLTQQLETSAEAVMLQNEVRDLERRRVADDGHLDSIAGRLEFVAGILSQPEAFIRSERCFLRLNRRASKLEPGSEANGGDLQLSKIHIASHDTRIAALVRFPRAELLPRPDMLKQADLFLAM